MSASDRFGMILMVGGGGQSRPVERALRQARQAAARDLIAQAVTLPQLTHRIVLSDDPAWLETLRGLPLQCELVPPEHPFHFGQVLGDVIARYRLDRCFYSGGGSLPLLSTQQLEAVMQQVADADGPLMVTNNLHSTDWAVFAPAAHILPLVQWLIYDNALAWVWQEKTGHPVHVLPRSAVTQMDIDTPFDLLALARHPRTQPHLRAFLDRLDWPAPHLDAAMDVLRREASHVIVAGRVSSWAWYMLETHTRCWARVFAEERGMRASGRQARGEVRSLLSDFLDLVGLESFFERLSDIADAIFLDSRVIMASHGLWPCDADRFYSDLLMDERIEEPFLRALTAAARRSPAPVVMGGHSLVAGGLVVLLEGAGLVPPSEE